MDPILIGVLVFVFFLILTLFVVFSGRAKNFSESLGDDPLTSTMEFPWGKIFAYDSAEDSPKDSMPILFIHSLGASIYCWRHQLPYFKTQNRVIALDLLGFGKSDKDTGADYRLDAQAARILEFLKAKKIEKCYLVGCSMGGAFALWLSHLFPERFPKTVVISPAAAAELIPVWDPVRLSPLARFVLSPQLIGLALRKGYSRWDLITDEVLHSYFEPYKDVRAAHTFLKSTRALRDKRIFDSLSSRSTPTLILWGARDFVVSRSIINKIHRQTARAILEVHPTGGHHLMEDESDWVNKKIRDFFNSSAHSTND